jgi:hypothetical protein
MCLFNKNMVSFSSWALTFLCGYRGFKPEAKGPPAGIYVWGVMI